MPTDALPPLPHRQHTALARPALGEFGRHELAVLGAPCAVIGQLVADLLALLPPALRVAYVDADHPAGDDAAAGGTGGADAWLQAGASAALTDKISFRRLDLRRPADAFAQRQWLAGQSLVLVNGNHFRARQQVVIIDPRKPLDRKLDRLTEVKLVLVTESQTEIPAYLAPHLPPGVPVLPLANRPAIAAWLNDWWTTARPPLRGLVLAGGQSQRMQTDKSRLRYGGRTEQRARVAALLTTFCDDVLVSCRPDQAADLPLGLTALPDQFLGLGPMSGLLTAFRHDPNTAWLAVACDLPFLTPATVAALVAGRQPARVATTFRNPATTFPEPLLTIWEPAAYGELLRFLSLGYSCPRKVLINTDVEVLTAPDPAELRNVNTPEERAAAEQELDADGHRITG